MKKCKKNTQTFKYKIAVRGGGDLATGVIHRLWSAGFPVLVLETAQPSAIRRQVSLCEAVYGQTTTVEGMTGILAANVEEAFQIMDKGMVPVLVDPTGECLKEYYPDALVDAIIAKQNLGTSRDMAPLTVALGPGFCAGKDVDVVIETSRGHNLGRIIREGMAKPNTGIPGMIGGYAKERVIHAPAEGRLYHVHEIGDQVAQGEIIATIESENGSTPVPATISGMIRGLIREGYPVTKGFKIADIDPRLEEYENCFTISDKARCIAGSVLEVVCRDMLQTSDLALY